MEEDDPLGGGSKKRPLEKEDDKEGPPLKQTKKCQDFLMDTDKRYCYWVPELPTGKDWQRTADQVLTLEERQFMDEHKLWRPSFSVWLQQSYERVRDHASRGHRKTIQEWNGCGYKFVAEAFQTGAVNDTFLEFRSLLLELALPLPRDTILFEGHVNYRPCKPGDVLIRKRPTSTSWVLKVAMGFADDAAFLRSKPSTLFVHRFPDETVGAINIQSEHNHLWHEAEVIVAPFVQLHIDRVLEHQRFPSIFGSDREVCVVFTTVTRY